MIQTNNQWLSLTDQLRLGVRMIELDTHWVEGRLRIAHCGGLHSRLLNALVKSLNTLATWAGVPFKWDSETVGCNPSLSSIPAAEQLPLADALAEVGAWMRANPQEFLVLYFDDEADLRRWVRPLSPPTSSSLCADQAQLIGWRSPSGAKTSADACLAM